MLQTRLILQTSDLIKAYNIGGYRALDNVSLSVPEGFVFGLLGPNGAGKTTLIRILTRILTPDSGTVFFKGRPMEEKDLQSIGYMPEERGLYRKMKVSDQVLYLARLRGMTKNDAVKRARELFETFSIGDLWNRTVEELSKGMAQKIQFISSVIHNPSLLILDEPFSGLDPVNSDFFKKEIQRLSKEGTTVILSTHDMTSVEQMCDSIALFSKGRVVLDGPVNEIRKRFSGDRFSLKYNGDRQLVLSALRKLGTEILSENEGEILFSSKDYSSVLSEISSLADIHEFCKVTASMNEIFINAVRSNEQKS